MRTKLDKNISVSVMALLISVMILLVMISFIPAIAGAHEPGDGRPGKGRDKRGHHRPPLGIWHNLKIIQELKLTDKQVKQLRELDFDHREKSLTLKAQLDKMRLQLRKAFSDDIVDKELVRQKAEKIADIKGKLFVRDIESRLAFREILNPDQIKKLGMHHQKKRGANRSRNCPPKQYLSDGPTGQPRN